jgi:hypothetical protein
MKLTLRVFERRSRDADKRWPSYLFGGRVRTSTLVLIVALFATWWTYNTYRPHPPPPVAPQFVPPGYIPDPNYTWVPRTRVQEPTYDTPTYTPRYTPTTTVPTTTPPTTPPTTTTPPPLFQLPWLPPPFGPGTSTPSPAPPGPTPTPAPAPAPGFPGLPGLPG